LDYHLSNENYINAKLSIINLNNINPTLICIDKFKNLIFEFSKKQNDLLHQSKFISSIDSKAEFYYSLDFNSHGYSKIDFQFPGLDLTLKISTLLKFNIENYISAIALIFKHLSLSDFKKIDSQPLRLPEGRGELLKLNSGKVLIDFAHDHQSMQNILSALAVSYKEIVLVFGCGGDRDKSKRPKMMRVAQSIAQKIIFTSDNNRFEEFALIAADALKGNELKNTTIIENRKEAITEALKYLNEDNILVILGKGHETHMETLGKKIIFNDKDCVLKISNNETY
jgi:UDP-N-acetylmuramyl tripeptide synthase